MTARTHHLRTTTWQMTLMALRYLGGRKLRTALTTLAIVFGVALIFSMNLVLPGIMDAFNQTMATVTGADLTVTNVAGGSFEPGPALDRIQGTDGVQAATGILLRQFSLPEGAEGDILGDLKDIELVGVDPARVDSVGQIALHEGRFLEPGESGSAVISTNAADLAPDLQVGTAFSLVTAGGLKTFTVVGTFTSQSVLAVPQFIVTLPDAQAALNQPGLINAVEVLLEPGADRDGVAADLQRALGESYTLDDKTNLTALPAIDVAFAMFNLFGALALFLGAFLIFNTFRTVVLERRRDLGMLRAIGATRRQITQTILIEGAIQGIGGTLIGLLLGYGLALGMMAIMVPIMDEFISIDLEMQYSASAFAIPLILGPAVVLAASYWPARTAGKMSPLEALRPVPAVGMRRAARWSVIAGGACVMLAIALLLSGSTGAVGGALLFLAGMVIAAPGLVFPAARLFGPLITLWFAREGDLARGNVARQPGRAAITASTLMIGVATIVMMAALVSAMMGMAGDLTRETFASDVLVVPQSVAVYNNVLGADENLAGQLKALPEVETVATLRAASSSKDGSPLAVLGIDPAVYAEVSSMQFVEGSADEAYAALADGRNAIVTALAQSTLGLDPGSDFAIETAEGPQTYRVVAVAHDVLTFKTSSAIISQANLAADFHKTEDVMLMLNLAPGADKSAALANVQDTLASYPQFTAHLSSQYGDDLIETSMGATRLFYFIAALILIPAGLGLLNTLTINVLERTREIGMVRAVGGSRAQVRRMVTGEALLLGIFGAAMGVLSGVAISYGVIAAFSMIGWQMPYAFPVAGIIAALIIGVLLALSAGILPARSAAKLDIIRALQYE